MRVVIQKWFDPRKLHFWILIALLVGVVLRCIQYFGATSLWLDEVACGTEDTEAAAHLYDLSKK